MGYPELDNMKKEKAKAMMRYHRVRKIANLFRLLEVVFVLIVFYWLSTQLPCVVEVFGMYLKKVCVVVVSPVFVFLIGNAIVITLFLNSGQFSSKSVSTKKQEDGSSSITEFVENRSSLYSPRDEIVFQDKQTVWEEISKPPEGEVRPYRRSRSAMVERPRRGELRRSETSEKMVLEDEEKEMMSNEEFQKTIEAFIAKQAKFHWDESMAIVVQSQSCC